MASCIFSSAIVAAAQLDLHLHVQAKTYRSLWFPLGHINEELVKVFYVFIFKVILLEKQMKKGFIAEGNYTLTTKQQVFGESNRINFGSHLKLPTTNIFINELTLGTVYNAKNFVRYELNKHYTSWNPIYKICKYNTTK